MPLGVFNTNIQKSAIPDGLARDFSKLLSERLHRDEKFISIHINPDQHIIRDGTDEPAGYVNLFTSRGYGDIAHRRAFSQAVLDLIKHTFKLQDASRFMVFFKTPSCDDIGLDGGLVSDRYGCMSDGGPFSTTWCKWKKEDDECVKHEDCVKH